jgi:hypothetical protein
MLEAAHENDIELEGYNYNQCSALLFSFFLILLPAQVYGKLMLGDKPGLQTMCVYSPHTLSHALSVTSCCCLSLFKWAY